MARIIRERMTLQDADQVTPYDLINGLTGLGVYALARWPRPGAASCLLGVIDQPVSGDVVLVARVVWA